MAPASSDRNLLFGILAVHLNFIDRDALIAAMNAWLLDKATPLDEIMLRQGVLRKDLRELLATLVNKHLELHDGDPQRSLAALGNLDSVRDELCSLADADVKASMQHVGVALDPMATTPMAISSANVDQRFRIIRFHAEGGLGKVSKAFDDELNRQVALKEIKAQHADRPESRARFIAEAKITGRLEHPGIVPVYGMGTYADGRPYYAMRFIEGQSLKAAIESFHQAKNALPRRSEQSLELRRLLRHFLDTCNAIHYAHSRGILHRDIKPANIMIGKYGETLVVDWGLAKAIGKSSADETHDSTIYPCPDDTQVHAPTQLGSAVGTPAFMSPEQAAGRIHELSPTSDVFSLGATLYQLLTGDPPYVGKDSDAVVEAARKGDIVPPRGRDSTISKGLDAICRKALARLPDERYQTPRDLADDITRWTADEVTSAYREPLAERAARWARHNRGWTQSAAVALVLVTLVSVIASIMVNSARTGEAIAHDTQRAIAGFLRGLFEDTDPLGFASTSNEFRVSPRRANMTARDLLSRGVDRLRGELAEQPAARAEFLETIGNVYRGLGLYSEASTILRESLDLRKEHASTDATAIALNIRNLAWAMHYDGKYSAAAELYRDSLRGLEAALGPEDAEIASTKLQYALLLASEDVAEYERALTVIEEAISLRRRILGQNHQGVAIALAAKAAIFFQLGEEEKAAGPVAEAYLIFSEYNASAPRALGNYSSGLQALAEGKAERAANLLGKAVKFAEEVLGDDHPYVAFALADYAAALFETEQYQLAEQRLEQAKRIARNIGLGDDHPKLTTLRRQFAELYLETDRGPDARKMLEINCERALKNAGEFSKQYASACQELAYVLQKLGRASEALAQAQRSVAVARRAHVGRPHRIAFYLEQLGLVQLDQHQFEEAVKSHQEAVELRRKMNTQPREFGESLEMLGRAQLRAQLPAAARLSLVAARERFLDFNMGDRAARAQALLGEALLRNGDEDAAETELLKAFERLNFYAPTHAWHMHVRRTLVELYEKSGNEKLAAEYRQ